MKSIANWRKAAYTGGQYIFVVCPGCGSEYRLEHDISADGVVHPSVECPDGDCDFHDTVILVGWNAPALKATPDV